MGIDDLFKGVQREVKRRIDGDRYDNDRRYDRRDDDDRRYRDRDDDDDDD